MAIENAQFTSIQAAADYMGNGAIIVPEFEKEITDLVRRAGVLGQRISYVPATGSPSRFFEQTAIADGQYTDPRAITATPTSPTRVEKSVVIKAVTNQINYGLFDLETTAQQGIFASLKAKDMKDMVNGMLRIRDKGLWIGTDTVAGNQVGNGGVQYVGLLNQITKTATIGSGVSIIDGIRTEVAKLVADQNYAIKPSAIYINPLALDFLEQEVKNSNNSLRFIQTDITDGIAGLSVTGVVTSAGVLPLIPEPFLAMDAPITGIAAATGGAHNYPFAIVCEELIEFHYVGAKNPRVFQLGTLANLNESYVGVQFGAPVVKGGAYAHVVGAIVR